MSVAYRSRRARRPSSTDWLQVLDVDGPFLAAPVVQDTWPDGLPALDQAQMNALRSASTLYDANPGARDAFIRHVLQDVLDWRHNLSWGPDAAPLAVAVPEHHTTVDVTFALRAQDAEGAVQDTPLLLGVVLPPRTATTGRAPAGIGTWTAGPADRLAHALRARKVPLGIVTNGDTWTLVTVAHAGAVSTASWTRHAWLEEPQTLRAFVALLTRTRFFGVPAGDTLPGLLTKSLARQEEVTERLAEQSQAVVEMLVATLGRLDAQHRAEHADRLLPPDVGPAEVYQAAVTVLMRLVFLLYAEERGLLPLDDDTYASAYAVNTLADALRERATDHGEDALERSATGWYRLLALFRGVHRGARHEQLVLPAYGGSLFDPDRFPWLEGRASADQPLGSGEVPAIDDRTLLKALDSLQTLQFAKERRQVSYRSLDVEQIGYVYEGLLDQDALTATDWVVSVAVSDKDPRKNGPELHLADLEAKHAHGDEALATWLVEQIKGVKGNRSKASVLKALSPLAGDEKRNLERLVREACGNDDAVTSRVLPFARLLRIDPRDLPVVYPPGSLYLTNSSARASTGAVYTPRFLAEQVVETTLEAVVYSPGPLDTEDKSAWALKTPEQILDLKVCDIAAGSGAFLVAAARYLADRLLESRRLNAEPTPASDTDLEPGRIPSTPATVPAAASLLAAAQAEQNELDARRDVIAHCIYGVDINPMALEMAKLSLWLTSLDRNRPFSFLDDHLAVGDSLLGITNPQQLLDLHLDPKKGRALHRDALELFSSTVESDLKVAVELRAQITQTGDRDSRDAETKQRLLRRAQQVTERLALIADGLSAASLAGGKDTDYLALASLVSAASSGGADAEQRLRDHVQQRLKRELDEDQHRPAHFPLVFPEAFFGDRSGFDAVVGNPPFLGGKKISGSLGVAYRGHLARVLGRDLKGVADLAGFMLLAAASVVSRAHGMLGVVATNSLAQGDTREVGLEQVLRASHFVGAIKSEPWPTAAASLEYCIVWLSRRPLGPEVRPHLDGARTRAITPSLDAAGRSDWKPLRLNENLGITFQGSVVLGAGFLLDPSEALDYLVEHPTHRRYLQPYLSGDDLNRDVAHSASRWIINFGDLGREAARAAAPVLFEQVERLVRPERLNSKRANYRDRWWQYAERCPGLYRAISEYDEVIVIAQVSSTVQPVLVPARQVLSMMLVVVASDDPGLFATLSSSIHYWWTIARSSTLQAGIRYVPSDVFETLPFPKSTDALRTLGEELRSRRSAVMQARGVGLTKTYNLVHDPARNEQDVVALRNLHRDIDEAVCASYDWTDLDLGHAHYPTRQGVRWTVRPEAQTELLDRLLELNRERHEKEVSQGSRTRGPVKNVIRSSIVTDRNEQALLWRDA